LDFIYIPTVILSFAYGTGVSNPTGSDKVAVEVDVSVGVHVGVIIVV